MSSVENQCSGCRINCCLNFKITRELTDPKGLKKELMKYPYIKQIRKELVIGPHGQEKIIGIYSCGRFNLKNSECSDYYKNPRPEFCLNTGITSKPHNECKLKNLH